MTEKEAKQEACRCLRCDHFGYGIFKGGANMTNEMSLSFSATLENEPFVRTCIASFVVCLNPTIDEIAKELGVEKEEIAFCLDAIQDPVSLQEPVYGDDTENIYVEDQIKDKKNSDENWADDITLLEVMKKLKEKERNIINKRFFEGRTQMEVAEEIGISQAQVSRLEKNAIEHIKKLYN